MYAPRKIRDPIHGFIKPDVFELNIVNTPIFQRLRGISQLAFAHLVYPGARHTRFEHSLGVYHIAKTLAEKLELNNEEKKIIKVAALLHDLGHGPFSHVSEEVLEIYAKREEIPENCETEKIHELITQNIISTDPDLKRYICENDCSKITELLSCGYGQPFLKSIVSGPIDADKQDYFLRDSYYCGVKYGIFDLNQLLTEFKLVVDESDGYKYLGISKDGIHALEQFFLAKYYLTTQVYRHKVRLITDQMLIRAIRLGIEVDEIEGLKRLYEYDNTTQFVENYKEWDDSRFIVTFRGEKYRGKLCYDLLERLYKRRLFKQIYYKKLKEFPENNREYLSRITEPSSVNNRENIEKSLSEEIKKIAKQEIDNLYVILNSYNVKSVYETVKNEEPILVDKEPKPIPFNQESEIFRSIEPKFSESYIEIYAPLLYDNAFVRDKLLKDLSDPITELLINKCKIDKGGNNEN